MRIGRSRIAPASISASRSGMPCFSRAHFAKSMSRIAFFATMPISRITPIRLMMLIVLPVIARLSITPMSDSGSDSMIASGSRNDPNCITRIRYMSTTATPSARKICPNTSSCCCASPPFSTRTPGGGCSASIARSIASFVTSPSDRPEVLNSTDHDLVAIEVVDLRRPDALLDRRDLAERHRASARRSGPESRAAAVAGRRRAAAPRARAARTRRASRRSDPPSRRHRCRRTPDAAPARPDRPSCRCFRRRRGSARPSSSGFWPFVDSDTSTAPGTFSTLVSARSAYFASSSRVVAAQLQLDLLHARRPSPSRTPRSSRRRSS